MFFICGLFWVCGDIVEIIFFYEELVVCIEFFGDEIEVLYYLYLLIGEVICQVDLLWIFFVIYYVVGLEWMVYVVLVIEEEFVE